ncbi:MAG: FHA domain-containing protein, partial [Anaerolineae bacterium]|nr:FHA domain-containing protein [Anaerolineae bacterium]
MPDDKTKVTRHLGMPEDAKPMAPRPTGPLDHVVPWVIEFRVVGTAYIIQAPASEAMYVGRGDPKTDFEPDVDLTPYAAHVLGVSRKHAMISVRKDSIVVKDLNSANGTFLNGHVLASDQEYRLRHGDQLSFGQLHLQVQFVVTPGESIEQVEEEEPIQIPILGKGQHVLIVNDDVDVAQLIGSILETSGFKVTRMTSAVEALNLVTRIMPNAIVFEMVLPDMSGLELARYVRKQESGRKIPLIAISGAPGGSQAREVGV